MGAMLLMFATSRKEFAPTGLSQGVKSLIFKWLMNNLQCDYQHCCNAT